MRLMQNHYYSKSAIDIMKGEKVDGIEERANKLQNEVERKCSQKIKEATEYKDGYVQGVEDLLTAIRRGGVKDESKKMR